MALTRSKRAAAVAASEKLSVNERQREARKRKQQDATSANECNDNTPEHQQPQQIKKAMTDLSTQNEHATDTAEDKQEQAPPRRRKQPARARGAPSSADEPPAKRTRKTRKRRAQEDPFIGQPKPVLSMELWSLILVELEHFPPSQLIELGLTSKAMHSIVASLPVWETICSRARLGPLRSRGKSSTPYLLALTNSARVCEQCYGFSDMPRGSQAALPVYAEEHRREINMCLQCRRLYYAQHPEPLPPPPPGGGQVDNDDDNDEDAIRAQRQRTSRITKGMAMATYKLHESHMDSIPYVPVRNPYYQVAPPMRLYEPDDVRTYARHIHGGDVGIRAALTKSFSMVQARRNNLQQRQAEAARQREARREAAHARMEQEQLDTRIAAVELEQHISDCSISLDELVELIRTRQGRRDTLEAQLQAAGVEVNPEGFLFRSHVSSGFPELDAVVAQLTAQHRDKVAREQRRQELIDKLRARGLELNEDSHLCKQYIATATGNADHIADTRLELEWLCRETVYEDLSSINGQARNDHRVHVHYKRVALAGTVHQRVNKGLFTDVAEDPDTPSRPPRTLWEDMNAVTPGVWRQHASDQLIRQFNGLCDNEPRRRLVMENGPDCSRYLTDEYLSQLLNASVTVNAAPQHPFSFAAALHERIGADSYTDLLDDVRTRILSMVRSDIFNMVADEVKKHFGIDYRWVTTMDQVAADQRKQEFIEQRLPVISRDEHIHPDFLPSVAEALFRKIRILSPPPPSQA